MYRVALEGVGQQICTEKVGGMVSPVALCHTMNKSRKGVPFPSYLMLYHWPEAWGLSIQQKLDFITADLAFLDFL